MTGYSGLATDRNKCGLNQTSACFLCLKEPKTNENLFSLRNIYRYLQINCQKDMRGRSISGGGENAGAPLCDQCVTIMEPLSKLCTELELLQMRVHHYLELVNNKLLKEDSSNRFQDNLNNNQTLNNDVELTKFMRKKVQQKCQVKLSEAVPKVMLTKDSSFMLKDKILKTEPLDEMDNSENSFTNTSTPLARDDDIGDVESESDGETVEGKITKDSFESHIVKNSNVKYTPCNLCNPPRMTHIDRTAQHQVMSHLDNWFLSSKNSRTTQQEFKDYCFHILKIELLSLGTQSNAKRKTLAKCQYCSFSATTEGEMNVMRRHVCIIHKEIVAKKLVELQRSTTPDELRAFHFPSSLTSSLSLVDGGGKRRQREYKCNLCSKIFLGFRSVWKHKLVEHKNTAAMERLLKCSVCHRVFQLRLDLLKHRKMVHKMDLPVIKCAVCSKVFQHSQSLRKHTREQHDKNAPVHKCNVCEKVFKHRGTLVKHGRLEHEKITPMSECDLCGRVFKHVSNMKRHKRQHKYDQRMTHQSAGTLRRTKCSVEVNTAENSEADTATSTMVIQIVRKPITTTVRPKVEILDGGETYGGMKCVDHNDKCANETEVKESTEKEATNVNSDDEFHNHCNAVGVEMKIVQKY